MGEEKKPFIVHKDLLCYWSKYFDKALNGSFQEAGSSMIPVTDVDPNIFACFMQWLYAQPSVPSQDEPEESAKPVGGSQNSYQEPSIEPGHFHDVFKMLLKLYIFGDRYDICDLRKDVMSKMTRFAAIAKRRFRSGIYHHSFREVAALLSILQILDRQVCLPLGPK